MIAIMDKPSNFEDTLTLVENTILGMEIFCREIPAPCMLFSSNDIVLWYNAPMTRVLRGFNGRLQPHAHDEEVLNKSIRDVFYKPVADYVLYQNALVRASGLPQYDNYTSQVQAELKDKPWSCFRFPVVGGRVGVILLPGAEDIEFFSNKE